MSAWLLLIAPGAGAQLASLEQGVPADAVAMVRIHDVSELGAGWKRTPLAALWNDPQVRRWLDSVLEDLAIDDLDADLEEETGYTTDQILEMFTGGAVWYLGPIDDISRLTGDDLQSLPAVLLAEVGDNGKAVERLLLDLDRDDADEIRGLPPATSEFSGVEIHTEWYQEDGETHDAFAWSVFEGLLAVAMTREAMEGVIADVRKGGVSDAIPSSANFQSAIRHLDSPDALLFINLEALMPLVREAMNEELSGSSQSSPIPMDPEALYEALGLDQLRAAVAGLSVDAQTVDFDIGMTFTRNTGLVKVLAYGPGEAPRPGLVPADSPAFATARIDFKTGWQAIEEIIGGINPALLGMVRANFAAQVEQAGVELDLRRDVLDNLGGDLIVVRMPPSRTGPSDLEQPPIEASQVLGVSIKQRQSFELAVEALKTIAAAGSELFETRDYLGTTIHTLKMERETGAVAYAITDDSLLISIGSTDALEAVLVAASSRGRSAWDDPGVRRAVAALPGGASGLSYQDLAATGATLLELMAAMAAEDGDPPLVDPHDVPDPDVIGRYLGPVVTGVYKDDSSILLRSRLLAAEGLAE